MVKALWILSLVARVASGQCDSIDFNRDGLFPDTADQDDFISVFGGGLCSTGDCGDIDFNNDGIFPDTADLDAFLRVFSGGPCRLDEPGWSPLLPPRQGARVVYISGAGSESNDGNDAQHPIRRWPTAWSRVRSGYGDRICVVGDVTLDETSGASMYHKSDFTVYGCKPDGTRPIIRRVGADSAFYIGGDGNEYVSDIALIGLDVRGEGGAQNGLRAYVTGGGWLIEDCAFTGFQGGMALIGNIDGVTVRRCDISANVPTVSHSQGVYIEGVRNILFDECVLDSNGRNPLTGYGTMFNHNAYVNATCTDVVFRNCITSRASATGLQLRWNRQTAVGNLVIDCPIGITLGHDSKLSAYPTEYVTGTVIGNFIVGTSDISPTEPRRGPGIGFGLAKNVTIGGNHFLDAPNAYYGAIRSDRPSTGVRVIGNYSAWPTPTMEWGGTANATEPTNSVNTEQAPKSIPTIEDYLRNFKIVPATKARFIELARANRKGAWDARWTAQGYIEWARTESASK